MCIMYITKAGDLSRRILARARRAQPDARIALTPAELQEIRLTHSSAMCIILGILNYINRN